MPKKMLKATYKVLDPPFLSSSQQPYEVGESEWRHKVTQDSTRSLHGWGNIDMNLDLPDLS